MNRWILVSGAIAMFVISFLVGDVPATKEHVALGVATVLLFMAAATTTS